MAAGNGGEHRAQLLLPCRELTCFQAQDCGRRQMHTASLILAGVPTVKEIVDLHHLIPLKDTVSRAWADSSGAWLVHCAAKASLRCYPSLQEADPELAQRLLEWMEGQIMSHGHTESWFMMVLLLHALNPILRTLDLSLSADISALPDTFTSYRCLVEFHQRLEAIGLDFGSGESRRPRPFSTRTRRQ